MMNSHRFFRWQVLLGLALLATASRAQDAHYSKFSQAETLRNAASNRPELQDGICWAYSVYWLDLLMSQTHSPQKDVVSRLFQVAGAQQRMATLSGNIVTNQVGDRYVRYLSLHGTLPTIYEYGDADTENGRAGRMAARMACWTMNPATGSRYTRRIEPALCYEGVDGQNQIDKHCAELAKNLGSSEMTFLLINLRFSTGGHTVAAAGKGNQVLLFDPNLGEEYTKAGAKELPNQVKDWVTRVAAKIGASTQDLQRMSWVTATASPKQ